MKMSKLIPLDDNWRPSAPQRKIKAKLHKLLANNPMIKIENLTPERIANLTGSRTVRAWMQDPNFRDWLANRDSNRELLESGAEAAISRLIEIIEAPEVGPSKEVRASDQISAAKTILEYSGYQPAKHKIVEYKDKDVAEMNEDELREYIQTEAPKLLEAADGE